MAVASPAMMFRDPPLLLRNDQPNRAVGARPLAPGHII